MSSSTKSLKEAVLQGETLPIYREYANRYKALNWYEVLAPGKEYAEAQLADFKSAAGNWVTCACGSQCAAIPRLESGAPADMRLHTLGMDFFDAITCFYRGEDERLEALRILQLIEERSAVLLKDLNII